VNYFHFEVEPALNGTGRRIEEIRLKSILGERD
jgi:hypothetical protein